MSMANVPEGSREDNGMPRYDNGGPPDAAQIEENKEKVIREKSQKMQEDMAKRQIIESRKPDELPITTPDLTPIPQNRGFIQRFKDRQFFAKPSPDVNRFVGNTFRPVTSNPHIKSGVKAYSNIGKAIIEPNHEKTSFNNRFHTAITPFQGAKLRTGGRPPQLIKYQKFKVKKVKVTTQPQYIQRAPVYPTNPYIQQVQHQVGRPMKPIVSFRGISTNRHSYNQMPYRNSGFVPAVAARRGQNTISQRTLNNVFHVGGYNRQRNTQTRLYRPLAPVKAKVRRVNMSQIRPAPRRAGGHPILRTNRGVKIQGW